jgi:vitamin B12 transporter
MFLPFRVSIIALICFNSFTLFAQQELNEVKVITTKLPQKENQLAKSVIILSDSVLRTHAGWTVSEILQQQVGISIAGASQTTGSLQSVFMRGGNVGHTLLLLDGVPLYDPSSTESNFDLNLLNIENIERIEILKGGQSTLYGSDAVAGVINFISKKGAGSIFKPSLKLNYGSFNSINSSGSASGKIQGLGYNVGVNAFRSNGFSSAVSDLPIAEKDGFQKVNYEASLRKNIAGLSTSIFGMYTDYSSDLDAGANVEDKDYVLNSTNFQYGGGFDYDKKAFSLHLKANSSTVKRVFENDSTYIPSAAFDNYSLSNFESKSTFIDLFSHFVLSSHFNLLLGADLKRQSIAQSYLSLGAFGPFEETPIEHKQTSITNTSLYSTINLTADNGIGMELGGRLNRHSAYGSSFSYNLNPFWRINTSMTAYAVYGTSFKNPSLYQLYSPYGNLDLKPEDVQNLDFGLKFENRKVSIASSVAYFQRQHKNKIGFMNLNQPPYGKYENIDWQNAQGIEFSLNQNLNKISFGTNYTYLIGKFGTNDEEGKNLFRRPKHQINISSSYTVSKKLNLSVNYQFQSKRNDAFYDSNTYRTVDVSLEPFHLLDLSSHYKITDAFSVFGTIKNALNQKYNEIYGYNSAPLNFRLGITYN